MIIILFLTSKDCAGKSSSGYCFRIYYENDYDNMPNNQESDIFQRNSDLWVLKLKFFGKKNGKDFNFLEIPLENSVNRSLSSMKKLGVFDEKNENLSEIGGLMAKMALEPKLSRIIVEGKIHGFYEEILVIAVLMNYSNILFFQQISDNRILDILPSKNPEFYDESSDLLTFLNIYDNNWMKYGNDLSNLNCINLNALLLAKELRDEIDSILKDYHPNNNENLMVQKNIGKIFKFVTQFTI